MGNKRKTEAGVRLSSVQRVFSVLILAFLSSTLPAMAEDVVLGEPAVQRPLPQTASASDAPVPPAPPTTEYSHGDPYANEQLVLEMINRARQDPEAEGTRLEIDITEGLSAEDAALVMPRPPLAMNVQLLQAARLHSEDMWVREFFDHTNPDGDDPGDRIIAQGYSPGSWGENIAASWSDTAAALEDALMIDAGIPGRGHRKNLLHIYDFPPFREVGIGWYSGSSQNSMSLRDFLTQDFGTESGSGAFIVGVVINDADGDDFYDIGEGMSGVTIMPDNGTYYAVSSTSGGYAIPVTTDGTLTVTASGGGLAGQIVRTVDVTVSGDNVKLDFEASEAVDPLTITTTSLPSGITGQSYSQSLQATGGIQPYSWSIDSGSLPSGLSLNSGGLISGVPDTAGTFNFTVQVTDAGSPGATDTQALSIDIAADIDAPVLSLGTFILSGTAQDNSGSVVVEVAGTQVPLYGTVWTSAELAAAESPVTVRAGDSSTNETTITVTVTP